MMENLMSLLAMNFFRNALLASLLASITCGIIGTYIVSRRIVFISGGITHASFGGIGMGYYMGFDPILGAVLFGIFSALGIGILYQEGRSPRGLGHCHALGVWNGPGDHLYLPDPRICPQPDELPVREHSHGLAHRYSFPYVPYAGNWRLFILFYRMILFISFDEEYALTNNTPVRLFNMILICLVALTIVLNIRVVGIILVMSLLTIPQAISNLFTRYFHKMIFFSIFFGFVGSISGLVFSYVYDIPSGAAIIFALVLMYGIAKLFFIARKSFTKKQHAL